MARCQRDFERVGFRGTGTGRPAAICRRASVTNGPSAVAGRILPALTQMGSPVLLLSYRNDAGAPSSPDGYYHLGGTSGKAKFRFSALNSMHRAAERTILTLLFHGTEDALVPIVSSDTFAQSRQDLIVYHRVEVQTIPSHGTSTLAPTRRRYGRSCWKRQRLRPSVVRTSRLDRRNSSRLAP